MANITLGLDYGAFNPYSVTVTNSGTLVGSDIELVIDKAAVTSKMDVILALVALIQFYSESPTASQTGQGAAPP